MTSFDSFAHHCGFPLLTALRVPPGVALTGTPAALERALVLAQQGPAGVPELRQMVERGELVAERQEP